MGKHVLQVLLRYIWALYYMYRATSFQAAQGEEGLHK